MLLYAIVKVDSGERRRTGDTPYCNLPNTELLPGEHVLRGDHL